ncbi:hypothetical protein I6B53_01975 [Schaalia sp. 19OD2882]|nr:hypothetical protein I6B53_01975 [Schaalia sp. 19OD2882]
MLAGAPTGFAGTETYRQSSSALLYVLGLDVIQVCGAIACLGLVRPWGERVPAWVPGIGGREIPRLLPLIVGGVGNLILYRVIWRLAIHFTLVWTGVEQGWTPTDGMNATQTTVIALCYAPMLAWPAALSIALVGYALRRRRRLPAHPAPDAGA